jgi:hypothetical protein
LSCTRMPRSKTFKGCSYNHKLGDGHFEKDVYNIMVEYFPLLKNNNY